MPVQPEFNFNQSRGTVGAGAGEEEEVEDKMDWMGDRLAMLIAEGQKALGKEVVVMSEAAEDEVDDGSGEWVDQGPSTETASIGRSRSGSRSGSIRRRGRAPAPNALTPSTWGGPATGSLSVPSSASAQQSTFAGLASNNSGLPMSLPNQNGGISTWGSSSDMGSSRSFTDREDVNMLESAELRESMARARAAYLAKRGGAS